MKVLASYNVKGGVGKTAAAVNLAWCAAADGNRTLIWDLDPQGAASFYFRIKPKVKGGAERLLEKRREVREAIHATDYPNLDLLPADLSYRNMDLGLAGSKHAKEGLARLLAVVDDDYDYVILDCPPSLSLVSENVFHAADYLLIPLIPTPLSLRAYDQLVRFVEKHGIAVPRIPFFSMVDRRRRLHCEVVAEFADTHPELSRVYIPYASLVEQMGLQRAPIGAFAAGSIPGRAYAELWQAIVAQVEEQLPAPTGAMPN